MDNIQRLILICADADVSEADEPSRTREQSLVVLREIATTEGPGNITDMYVRASLLKGCTIEETDYVIGMANASRHSRLGI